MKCKRAKRKDAKKNWCTVHNFSTIGMNEEYCDEAYNAARAKILASGIGAHGMTSALNKLRVENPSRSSIPVVKLSK